MINQSTGQELWLYIETQIIVDDKMFYEGVCWVDYEVNEDGSFTVHSNINGLVSETSTDTIYSDVEGVMTDYIIPKENAFETNVFTHANNIPRHEWSYRQRQSPVTDYIKATKDYLGIVMTSEPTFRDGQNPYPKGERSID